MTITDFIDRSEQPVDDENPQPMNIIDIDTANRATRPFSIPDAVRAVSLGHHLTHQTTNNNLPADLDPMAGISNYLLLGQCGSVTDFHQDFSATSVFYFVLRGAKVFFLVRPSEHNVEAFREWSQWTTENNFRPDR